jgi:multidrug efflux pump subunit AcrA (membrane-fusion protein)
LTFDALSGKEYTGEVSEISVIATSSQGVVNYPVTVRITDADDALRPGMTAAVSIIVDQHDDVLLVPTKAIRTVSGQRTVSVMYEGQQISVSVTVGLADGTNSEVTSEQLREGDTVVLFGTTTTTISSSNNQNRGGQGGFGGPGGGMFPP